MAASPPPSCSTRLRFAADGQAFTGRSQILQGRVIGDNALTAYQKYVVNWSDFNPAHLSSTQHTTTSEYDALNRIRKALYPQGLSGGRRELTPAYNKGGALHSLKLGSNTYVEEIAYNARGQRLLMAMGNGVMTRYAYDNETFRLARIRSEKYSLSGLTYTSTGAVQQDLAYTYDLEGTILSQKDDTPASSSAQGPGGLLREFTHDPLRRLISATGRESSNVYRQPSWDLNIRPQDHTATNLYTRSYEYDKIGNIQNLNHVAAGQANQNFVRDYNYDTPADNRLSSFTVDSNSFANTYDGCGNLTKEGTTRYLVWGHNDKPVIFYNRVGTSTPTVFTHYFYNAQGDRVKKITRKGQKLEVTVYVDGGLFELTYTKPTGSTIDPDRHYNTLYIKDGASIIATRRLGNNTDDSTPPIKFHLDDHLGSCTVILRPNGNLVNREEFYPFGETSFGAYAFKRYRYNGKEKDEESGLYNYGQRYYAPWLCRFVSVDPIAEDYPQYTSYNYAGNKPISKRDLEGLQEENAERPVDEGGNNVELENPKEVQKKSAMPENENIHNAPEKTEFEGKQGTDFDIASPGLAKTAYSESNPEKGFLQSGSKNFEVEVFWNPETKLSNGQGAYVWQRSKIEKPLRVKMEKMHKRELGTTLDNQKLITSTTPEKPKSVKPTGNPLPVGQTTVLSIGHHTDGTLILDRNGRSNDLDQIIQRIIATGDLVGSITLNSQIGIGIGPNELQFSQNLFTNVSNYIRSQIPNIQINRGWIGPASGDQRISPTNPSSLIINAPTDRLNNGNNPRNF